MVTFESLLSLFTTRGKTLLVFLLSGPIAACFHKGSAHPCFFAMGRAVVLGSPTKRPSAHLNSTAGRRLAVQNFINFRDQKKKVLSMDESLDSLKSLDSPGSLENGRILLGFPHSGGSLESLENGHGLSDKTHFPKDPFFRTRNLQRPKYRSRGSPNEINSSRIFVRFRFRFEY